MVINLMLGTVSVKSFKYHPFR
uniref:Uncharacterized protein n=1 Tax=Arundo donax TaxID=35708 RepID=A0A0A9C6X6_ARUDO